MVGATAAVTQRAERAEIRAARAEAELAAARRTIADLQAMAADTVRSSSSESPGLNRAARRAAERDRRRQRH